MEAKQEKDAKKVKPEKKAKIDKATEKLERAKAYKQEEENYETLVRILGCDIPVSKKIYVGLNYIKGVSFAISNAVCIKLKLDRNKKIVDLSKDEIKKIEEFLVNMSVPDYMKNRRNDPETGVSNHFLGTDLDMKRDFDIKRLKEMKSYRGIRHASKLPVRGQRTRSHFRSKSAAATMKKQKKETKT